MTSPLRQQTLRQSFAFHGVGIHTGQEARVTVHPAEVDAGRVFRCGGQTFPARADYVVDTRRCTTLGVEGVKLHTVEHLLSALSACQIDNAIIEVEGAEIPILDGSALPHAQAIEQSGIMAQDKPPRILEIAAPMTLQDRASELTAEPASAFQVEVEVAFTDWEAGGATQRYEAQAGAEAYRRDIAPARTFAFRQEVDQLLAAGLARGGSLDNALIITPPDTFSSPLRLPREWCAHKLLDVIGDLALLDTRPLLSIRALRPGHGSNIRLAQALLSQQIYR